MLAASTQQAISQRCTSGWAATSSSASHPCSSGSSGHRRGSSCAPGRPQPRHLPFTTARRGLPSPPCAATAPPLQAPRRAQHRPASPLPLPQSPWGSPSSRRARRRRPALPPRASPNPVTRGGGSSSGGAAGTQQPPLGGGGGGGNGATPPPDPWASTGPLSSGEDWDFGAGSNGRGGSRGESPDYGRTDWGWRGEDDWDPAGALDEAQLAALQAEYEEEMARARRAAGDAPRDTWITPLLDFQSIAGAFDPDQGRAEGAMVEESLVNREESREALSFAARLVGIPLLVGALVGRPLTGPVLNFTLANDPNAFALTTHQKIEAAKKVHMEEARVRMDVAIGRAPPLTDRQMMQHLREYAVEVNAEERHDNEAHLMTLVCDSISGMVVVALLARDVDGRSALFSTLGRLFEGLSDIAKAVLIILVADTMLGYHSEEGWTGLIDTIFEHYGFEGDEHSILIFVGIIPVAIDVLFKYWIFTGLNKISPGAVVTIKQIDRH